MVSFIYISTHFWLIPFPTIPLESVCQIQWNLTEIWSSQRYFVPLCVEAIGSWLKGETMFVFHWVKDYWGLGSTRKGETLWRCPLKGKLLARSTLETPAVKEPSMRKQFFLVIDWLHRSADAPVQIRSLSEILNRVYTEVGAVCCDLALPVLWADRGRPRAKVS